MTKQKPSLFPDLAAYRQDPEPSSINRETLLRPEEEAVQQEQTLNHYSQWQTDAANSWTIMAADYLAVSSQASRHIINPDLDYTQMTAAAEVGIDAAEEGVKEPKTGPAVVWLGGSLLGAGLIAAVAGGGGGGSNNNNHSSNTPNSTPTDDTATEDAISSRTTTGNTITLATPESPGTETTAIPATISFDSLNGDDVLNLAGSSSLVRVSGQLNTDSPTLQAYLERGWISQVNVTINGQTYRADVDANTLTFHFDAHQADLSAAAGQPVSIDYVESQIPYINEAEDGYYLLNQGIPDDADTDSLNTSISAENNLITGNNGYFNVSAEAGGNTQIAGSVSGANTGDVLTLRVNETDYTTEITADHRFSLAIRNSDLQADSDHTIEAILPNGSRSHAYAVVDAGSSANSNISSQSELPYFISALNNGATAYGYLGNEANWGGVGQALNVSYAFDNGSGTDRYTGASLSGSMAFSSQQIADITRLLSKYSEYTNIRLSPADDPASADMVFYLDDLSSFSTQGSYSGYAYSGGDVHLSSSLYQADNAFSSQDGAITILHEVLHSFGFEHPFDSSGDNNTTTLSRYEDQTSYSLMSYTFTDTVGSQDLRVFDLAALHYNFGVNPDQRSGNDLYTFGSFNAGSADGSVYIWDGSGNDTFSAADAEAGVTVNLTPGSWNHVGEKSQYFLYSSSQNISYHDYFNVGGSNNIITGWNKQTNQPVYSNIAEQNVHTSGQSFIGYGTQIENLIGSDHNDTLTGNDADNLIEGGNGDDTIFGGLGNDTIIGGSGADQMEGGAGNDSYYVDNINDSITETTDNGQDTVYSQVDHTLGENLENLTLLGSTAIKGTGNAQNNILTGNDNDNQLNGGLGDDIIIGGNGNNTLTGGEGRDIFVFQTQPGNDINTLTDFTVGEDRIQLSSLIFGDLDLNASDILVFGSQQAGTDTRLIYDTAGEILFYDADGSGNDPTVALASLSLDAEQTAAQIFIMG